MILADGASHVWTELVLSVLSFFAGVGASTLYHRVRGYKIVPDRRDEGG